MYLYCHIDVDTEVRVKATIEDDGRITIAQDDFDETMISAMQIPRVRNVIYDTQAEYLGYNTRRN